MKEVREMRWDHDDDEHLLDYHTSYLGKAFYDRASKKDMTPHLVYYFKPKNLDKSSNVQ